MLAAACVAPFDCGFAGGAAGNFSADVFPKETGAEDGVEGPEGPGEGPDGKEPRDKPFLLAGTGLFDPAKANVAASTASAGGGVVVPERIAGSPNTLFGADP